MGRRNVGGYGGTRRIRGLRDIKTFGTLCSRRVSIQSSGGAASSSTLGLGLRTRMGTRKVAGQARVRGSAVQSPLRAARGSARTWVFVEHPGVVGYQGSLAVERVSEPSVEVFDEGAKVVVLAELLGVQERDIDVQVHGDVLILATRRTRGTQRSYYRELLLPFPVTTQGMRRAFRNGVLELELAGDRPGAGVISHSP